MTARTADRGRAFAPAGGRQDWSSPAPCAMELDMHSAMTSFSSWHHIGGQATPAHLLSGMGGPERRYLEPDRRDFFHVTTP